jgi:hypothetical protein
VARKQIHGTAVLAQPDGKFQLQLQLIQNLEKFVGGNPLDNLRAFVAGDQRMILEDTTEQETATQGPTEARVGDCGENIFWHVPKALVQFLIGGQFVFFQAASFIGSVFVTSLGDPISSLFLIIPGAACAVGIKLPGAEMKRRRDRAGASPGIESGRTCSDRGETRTFAASRATDWDSPGRPGPECSLLSAERYGSLDNGNRA